MVAPSPKSILHLLLFIDDRPSAIEVVKEVQQFLQREHSCTPDLQIINVSGQPYLAEHFKIVITPALVKLHPAPRQIIAGKNLISQLQSCWAVWQEQAIAEPLSEPLNSSKNLANVSELIQLADEVFRLNQEKADLEEKLRFKDRIIAMLAHDIRNPLTAVSLALETVEVSGEKLTPQLMTQLLKHARNQTKAADSMIRDILEAARGTSAEFHIQPQKIRLDDLCHSVIEDFFIVSSLRNKQQSLLKDIPNDLPLVYADEERVRQVLTNLLVNAIKYTPVGGIISLAILHRTSQKIEISVTDNGPGIPPEMRDRIFEERYRLEREDRETGYGIGLALCQRIIRAHYGQIWVESAGKQGSSFRFTLPVY